MDDWLTKHMHGVLLTVEVLWVSGFLMVFVVYFIIKYRLRRRKSQASVETRNERKRSNHSE
jgi:heme/copper-type cytochrome/quinol oxidase subunit 2